MVVKTAFKSLEEIEYYCETGSFAELTLIAERNLPAVLITGSALRIAFLHGLVPHVYEIA